MIPGQRNGKTGRIATGGGGAGLPTLTRDVLVIQRIIVFHTRQETLGVLPHEVLAQPFKIRYHRTHWKE